MIRTSARILLVATVAVALAACSPFGRGGSAGPAPSSPTPAAAAQTPSATPASTVVASSPGTSAASPARPGAPATATPPVPQPFRLTAGQARYVATIVDFLAVYNAGRFDAALALLADDPQVSDCDYRAGHVIVAQGKDQVAAWLRQRIADHDQLTVGTIENTNPDQRTTGARVVAVAYARRTSDTLRALGFPNGIVPQLATKVIFTPTDDRIGAFNNGPGGGFQEPCRPAHGATGGGTPATPGKPAMPPAPATPTAATNRAGDLSIRLQVAKATFLTGEAGQATLTVRNEGAAPVILSSSCAPWNTPCWAFSILADEAGREVSSWIWRPKCAISLPGLPVALAPGQELGGPLWFQVPADARPAGYRYTLRASVYVAGPGGRNGQAVFGAPLALTIAPPAPARSLHAALAADRMGWRLAVTDAQGHAPAGPRWGVVEVSGQDCGGYTFQLLQDATGARWAGTYAGTFRLVPGEPITVRAWLAAPGYVTATATVIVPPVPGATQPPTPTPAPTPTPVPPTPPCTPARSCP